MASRTIWNTLRVCFAHNHWNRYFKFRSSGSLRAFRYSFFHRWGHDWKRQLQRRLLRKRGAADIPAHCHTKQKAIAFAFLHQRWLRIGAADEARTRYLHLGKVALYQMSYGRISGAFIPAPSRAILANFGVPAKACEARFCGEKEKIWYSSQKSCLQDFPMNDRIFDVVPPIGIEPMTRGFSVPCSTD